MRFLGVDLAWGEGSDERRAADTGVAALDERGRVLDAGRPHSSRRVPDERRPAARPCLTRRYSRLVEEPSPLDRVAYKRREDLLDAIISAWTAAFWHRYGHARCQVLGDLTGAASEARLATIIAPAGPEQRPVRASVGV